MPERDNAPLPDFDTICAHWGEDRSRWQGAVIPPIYQNTLFTFPNCEAGALQSSEGPPYSYTRYSNPTTEVVEAKVAALEGGERARCFGSGMGAISSAILSCVRAGDHVVAPETVYGPTRSFLAEYLERFGVSATFVDGSAPQEFLDATRPNTRLYYLESPSSLVMKQQDLTAVASLAKERDISTVCDNSWATPYFQNPLALGVDLVVHTATKYLGGHSDVVAGVVAGSRERMEKILWGEATLLGAVLDPFGAWLMLRGMRTLSVRLERHQQSARRIALALSERAEVARVFYPGLPDDPQLELTRRQLRGTCGLLSFALKDNSKEAAYRTVNALKWFGIGCSWGGFESLAIPVTVAAHSAGGEGDEPRWLIRLHIGLESVDDLWDDIQNALR